MEHYNSHNSPAGESLDKLIRESLRQEEDPLCVGRLEGHWRVQSRQHACRRLAWRAVPLVSAALLASIFFFFPRQELPKDTVTGGKSPELSSPYIPASHGVTVPDPAAPSWQAHSEPITPELVVPAENLSAGRPPTACERILFLAATRIQEPSASLSTTEVVECLIDRLAAEPAADVRAICKSVGLDAKSYGREEVEKLLLEKLADAEVERQRAILRLFAVYGTERALAQIVAISRDESIRGVSFNTIEAMVGVQRWGEVVRMTPDEEVRHEMMQRLLTIETQPALVAYLKLVRDETLRDEALVAGAEMPKLPVDGFIALLNHRDESIRLAAAVVLGRLNRCEMTTALIKRIQQQPSDSKEAWFALFACQCDAADSFLVHATRSPQLLGQFNNARLQWTRLSY